jgi:hypothetical protein
MIMNIGDIYNLAPRGQLPPKTSLIKIPIQGPAIISTHELMHALKS